MNDRPLIEIRIGRGAVVMMALCLALVFALLMLPGSLLAQKSQESFKEKFDIANENGGLGITASSDGKYVYVVGPAGILVSDDYGKTGSWVETVRLK
jgi:hypothetical protein